MPRIVLLACVSAAKLVGMCRRHIHDLMRSHPLFGLLLLLFSGTVLLRVFLTKPSLDLKSRRHSPRRLLLMAAFQDPRKAGYLTALVIGHRELFIRPIYCHLSATQLRNYSVRMLWSERLVDWNTHYFGRLALCPMPRCLPSCPTWNELAVSFNPIRQSSDASVPVQPIPQQPPAQASIVACVCPLYGSKHSPAHLATWIELHLLFGVAHFTFYDYSATLGQRLVLDHYARRGIVTRVKWRLPSIPIATTQKWPWPTDSLPYYGQVESNNECLYRWAHRYRYAMYVDLDELLFPVTEPTLSAVLVQVDPDNGRVGAFVFRMRYLRSDFPRENSTRHLALARNSILFQRSRVEKRLLNHRLGPKLIVRPECVQKISVHNVFEFSGKCSYMNAPADSAQVLHYRDPPGYLSNPSIPGRRNARLVSYLHRVVGSVESALAKAFDESVYAANGTYAY